MNEKIKSFFIGLAAGILSVLSFLGGLLFSKRNRSGTGETGADLAEAATGCTDAAETAGGIAETAGDGLRIIQSIKSKKKSGNIDGVCNNGDGDAGDRHYCGY